MRTAAKVLGLGVAAVALVAVGVGAGIAYVDGRDPIPPVRISQFYGVSTGWDDQGRYCIDGGPGARCAVPRLAIGAEVPRRGSRLRGGYGSVPSDSSDLPEPTWLWLTPIACPEDTADEEARCP